MAQKEPGVSKVQKKPRVAKAPKEPSAAKAQKKPRVSKAQKEGSVAKAQREGSVTKTQKKPNVAEAKKDRVIKLHIFPTGIFAFISPVPVWNDYAYLIVNTEETDENGWSYCLYLVDFSNYLTNYKLVFFVFRLHS